MKRILAAAVAASALALSTAACGSSDAGSGSSGSASSSSSASAAAASVKQGDTVTMAELGQRMQAAMKSKGTAKVSMNAGSTLTMTGAMKVTEPIGYTMSMEAAGRKMDMIYVDKVMYLGGDAFASMLNGKKFVKIDPDGTDALSKQMAPTLKQMETATDPSKMYQGMTDVKMTADKVEGDDVTYSAKLTEDQVKTYVAKQGQSIPSGTDIGDLTITMTLTKDNLPKAMTTEVGGQKINMTYSDWGTKVDISAPPASEVGTMPGTGS